MDKIPFTTADLEVLKQWATPTICNGLELIIPERCLLRRHELHTAAYAGASVTSADACQAKSSTVQAL
jgi:hypothetical protein